MERSGLSPLRSSHDLNEIIGNNEVLRCGQEEPTRRGLSTFGVCHKPRRIHGTVVRPSKDSVYITHIRLVEVSDLLSEQPKLPVSDPLRACRGSDDHLVGALKDSEERFGLTK